MTAQFEDPVALVEHLGKATNDHDLEAIVACFAVEYRNETPLHPERSFEGQEQVRKNWSQILSAVPDVTTEVIRAASKGDTVWSEWEHRGTKPDGSRHLMRGVVIFGVSDGRFAWARFYLEPVEDRGESVDEFVRRQVGSTS